MLNRNIALSRNPAASHLPYLVVAVGNPHDRKNFGWTVQYPDGTLSTARFRRAAHAERYAEDLAFDIKSAVIL